MVRLPPELLRPDFDRKLQRGALMVKNHFEFVEGKRRKKYFVVLNRDCAEERIHFFLITSKVEKFLRLPWGPPRVYSSAAARFPIFRKTP